LPLSMLLEAPTVRALARQVDAHATVSGVVALRKGSDTRPPLFLVHDGDGETLLYRQLALALDAGHSVYGLQPLAGQGLGMLHTRIPAMATHYIANLRQVQPQGPYLIAGLCAGGVIASEIALQLEVQGQRVAFVGILDAGDVHGRTNIATYSKNRFKSFWQGVKGTEDAPVLSRVMSGVTTAMRKTQNLLAYELQSRKDNAQRQAVLQDLHARLEAGLPPPDEAQDLLIRDIYLGARAQYQPTGKLSCATLFRATQGDGTLADEPVADYYLDPHFGWGDRVSGRLEVLDSPGGHTTMLQPPHVAVLAEQMQKAIDLGLAEPQWKQSA
jgi:thioesterase domain-containing protein